MNRNKDKNVTQDIEQACVEIRKEVTRVLVETIMLEMDLTAKSEDVIMALLEKESSMIAKVRSLRIYF